MSIWIFSELNIVFSLSLTDSYSQKYLVAILNTFLKYSENSIPFGCHGTMLLVLNQPSTIRVLKISILFGLSAIVVTEK